jgi:adenylate cyclase
MDSSGTGTILVVDDIPENVRLLEAVLVPRGYEVLTLAEIAVSPPTAAV